ncbi:hypothetical protein IFM89_037800 [Coptis chinensis]|uniref:Uncharacterized protein n=1 Tax=Coptis chinensis TaxID=261450 RepID=A0A835M624_9MAGN|nr:hypothetical protein IFM89_037800 [Coptis chinensis]
MEDKPSLEEHETKRPQSLSSSNSVRKRSNDSNSPEFEFWMVRNPSCPQPHLLSADELIADGVLLPLHLISQDPKPNSVPLELEHETEPEPSRPGPEAESSSTSKRWRDIFKIGEKKNEYKEGNNKEKEKKKERKSNMSSSAAELNINIWPFSRSWSAGNRPKLSNGSVSRKVSSAPCSRSNSAGESKSRKWPNSPSRGGGIHLGRNSPVWQVRRGASGLRNTEPVVRNNVEKSGLRKGGLRSKNINNRGGDVGASKGRVLNLNVPMCIGYRQQLSCRTNENVLVGGGGGGGGSENGVASITTGGAVGANSKLFNLRTLFTKKISVN